MTYTAKLGGDLIDHDALITYSPQLGGALIDHDALMPYSPKLGGDLIDALLLCSDFLGLKRQKLQCWIRVLTLKIRCVKGRQERSL